MPQNLIREKRTNPLTHYLRAHRKNAALSQRELTKLLGTKNQSLVSRHEQFTSLPSLSVALCYQALYRIPVSELFKGLNETIEVDVEARLLEFERYLGEQSAHGPRAAGVARKLEWLSERQTVGEHER